MKQYSSTDWLILIILSCIWGFSFYFMKNGLKTFTWDEVASMRITFSLFATLPLFIYHFKKIKRTELPYYAMVGLFGSGIPAFCFTFAQTHLDSGIAGILNSLTPIFTFIVGVFFFALPFNKGKLYGLITALAGAIILVAFDESSGGQSNLLFALPVLAATLSYAISANILKKFLQHAHPVALGATGFLCIGIPASVYLFSTDFLTKTNGQYFSASISSIAALAVFGTVIASIVFYLLIQRTDTLFGSLVTYLIPVVAVILGVMDGEIIKIQHIIGMLFILLGIYIVNVSAPFELLRYKRKKI